MKNVLYFIPVVVFSLNTLNVSSQSIKDEEQEYTYTQLPLTPLDKTIVNYQSRIDPAFEGKNKQAMEEYELEKKKAQEEFDKEKAAYPALLKEAEEKYAKEMEEYKKKSLGQKVIEKKVLNEDNKPRKNLPSQPYLRFVQPPVLQTSYDYPAMANTYVYLSGYTNNAANAVNIVVTLYGFDYTEPRVLSEQKTVANIGSSNSSSATFYHAEFSYRQPLSVKVTTPDGKEILNVTPPEFNNYKIYKSAASQTPPQLNPEMMKKTYEEKNMQDNLRLVNEMLNDKYGYGKVKRTALLYYVKSKNGEYSDLMSAYNDISSGLKILLEDMVLVKY